MEWEEERRFKERTYVYLCLIHVDVWHTPTQRCKAIILQCKGKKEKIMIFLALIMIYDYDLKLWFSLNHRLNYGYKVASV